MSSATSSETSLSPLEATLAAGRSGAGVPGTVATPGGAHAAAESAAANSRMAVLTDDHSALGCELPEIRATDG